jgi:arginyl-tRNA synthetase
MQVTRNIMDQVRQDISEALRNSISELVAAGKLPPAVEAQAVQGIALEAPKDPNHGHLASPVALGLAKSARMAPRAVAEAIRDQLMQPGHSPYIEMVEVAGPGFINFRLSSKWAADTVRAIRSLGREYGTSTHGAGAGVLVEFVSANPVGPMNVVNARAAAVGDTLVRLLKAAGYRAASEFYVNDAGRQVDILAESVFAHVQQLRGVEYEFPEEGYRGSYVRDIAEKALADLGEQLGAAADADADAARALLREFSLQYILGWQKRSLGAYGVEFDRWFSEKSLRAAGAVEDLIASLTEQGLTYEQEGALWFRSTAFGDDKDRVLIKNDGDYTYVAPDLAYHKDKLNRGFTKLIDILGPDHHGYEGRMQAGLKAFGQPDGTLEVLILQLVTLLRDGEPVKMSKRAGEFITMDDLLEDVPVDAARYFFIMRNTSSHLEFDLNLAKAQSMDNPVWYIQYAHARCCSIFRQAEAAGIPASSWADPDIAQLAQASEAELVRKMAMFPDEVLSAAIERAPSRMARFALDFAGAFHSFYTECRVITDDPGLTAARLALVDAARTVLANSLNLMGVSAPERM